MIPDQFIVYDMSNSATPDIILDASKVDNISNIPKRDPSDTKGLLRDRIEIDPTDIIAYFELIQFYEKNDSFTDAKEIYSELHKRLPYYAPGWCLQLKGSLARDEFETVEQVLAQCLSGDVENNDLSLWLTYLDYVRRKNNLITGGQEARAIVIKAFELVLEKCAVFEPNSTQFWSDYLGFLEQWKPVNKWEVQQRIDMIRKLYKRMLCVPFDSLEKMWNKYTQWEQDVNSLTARKFIGELSAEYMKARSLYQEWSNVTKGVRRVSPVNIKTVNKNNIPQRGNDSLDVKQLEIWNKWIEWEKENKLVLTDEDLTSRIIYVYKQAIQHMIFSVEIWYNYAMYVSDTTEREKILYNALSANPDSPSVTFKLAECYELDNKVDKVKECFDSTIATASKKYKRLQSSPDKDASEFLEGNITALKQKITFLYCIYMNTMNRLSGLSAARSVFGKCRKLKSNLSHDIYIENAYLEFQNQQDYKTACKVLELGLKYFQNDGNYVNKYLDFLILWNKDSQIKTLFETSIEKVDDDALLKTIYKKMICYESKFGNLHNVYSLEKRFFEKFPNENMIETFTDRYQIQHENMIKKLELTYMSLHDQTLIASSFNHTRSNISSSLKRSLDVDDDSMFSSNKRKNVDSTIPVEIVDLLKVLPKRQYFKNALLEPNSLVNFLCDQVEISNEEQN